MQENKITLDVLKQEVADLKNNNTVAIESFEKSLQELNGLYEMEDTNGISDLDGIEVFTMEEIPTLSESIRKIMV